MSTGGASVTFIAAPGGTGVVIGPAGNFTGFTISGGSAEFGAGLAVSGRGTVITKDVFESNAEASGGIGAAIGGDSASPIIARDLFTENSCDTQHLSAVVSFINSSSPTIKNNIFYDNPCVAIGLDLPAGTSPLVINNTLVDNTAGVHFDGITPGSQVGRNNIIVSNGIGLEDASGYVPTWDHNLVYDNTTDLLGDR